MPYRLHWPLTHKDSPFAGRVKTEYIAAIPFLRQKVQNDLISANSEVRICCIIPSTQFISRP